MKIHAVLTPRLVPRYQLELLTEGRVIRMGYAKMLALTALLRRSR
jgi:hypothetical protein